MFYELFIILSETFENSKRLIGTMNYMTCITLSVEQDKSNNVNSVCFT